MRGNKSKEITVEQRVGKDEVLFDIISISYLLKKWFFLWLFILYCSRDSTERNEKEKRINSKKKTASNLSYKLWKKKS